MAVKKVESFNIHETPAINQNEFDVETYLNANWGKTKEAVNNNAEELMQAQKDISTLKEDNKTNKSSIDVLEKSNETINKSLEDIDTKDKKQDEDIKANKESIEALQTENIEIKSENERLRKDIKSIAMIGEEKGESIHLEDSSDARCELEIGGNQEQETREGYNQLKNEGTTQTLNNVTITKKEDETLVVNGTATEDFTFSIKRNIELEDGEQYKLSGCPNGGAEKKYALTINQYYENQSHFGQDYGDGVNFTYNGSLPINNNIYIRLFKGITYNNLIFKPMIVKGTENKPYEQYGASPSFAYPSSVKAVGDVKNILNMSNAKGGTSGGITCNMIADGSYTYKGTASSKAINIWLLGSYNNKTPIFRLEPGTYYIDGLVLFDGNNVLANPDITKIFTFINAHDITGVRALDAVLENTYDETKYPIIAEIDHEIPWIPYDCGYAKIDIFNKNFIDIDKLKSLNSRNVYEKYNNVECLKLAGVTQRYNLNCKQNTQYVFQVNIVGYTYTGNLIGQFLIAYTDGSASYMQTDGTNAGKYSLISKAGKTVKAFVWNGYSSGHFVYIDKNDIQLDEATTLTNIVQHEEQSYLVDVQQPMFEGDTFVKQDGKWYEKHCWEKMLLNGTEKVGVSGASTNEVLAIVYDINNAVDGFGYSNYFLYSSQVELNKMSVYNDGKSLRVNVSKMQFADLESFKAKLKELYEAGTPVIIYYKLAEPILLECTEAQSKVLDEIYNKAHTYKNITNISVESAEVNPIASVKYLKDAETEHNKLQAQIDEIKQLLSTTETSALLVNNLEKDLRMEVE